MSSVFPDLSSARDMLESLMSDRCEVTRPGEAVEVFDEETGDVTTGPAPVIYDVATLGNEGRELEGRCLISERSDVRQNELGGVDATVNSQTATIPWDAPEIKPDDELLVVSSARDPQLTGTRFRVGPSARKSMMVSRKVSLERINE